MQKLSGEPAEFNQHRIVPDNAGVSFPLLGIDGLTRASPFMSCRIVMTIEFGVTPFVVLDGVGGKRQNCREIESLYLIHVDADPVAHFFIHSSLGENVWSRVTWNPH